MPGRPAAVDKLAALVHEKESRATEVARLLHDEAGQTLTAIGFHIQALGGDPEAASQIRGYLEQVMDSLRLACNQLQTNVVERSGLPLAVELLADHFREEVPSVALELRVVSERRFPAPAAHAVYRVIELALDNVRRHAAASTAKVFLRACNDGLSAEIHDNGSGFNPSQVHTSPPGAGLVLMGQYAGNASLLLRIESTPGQGTIIRIQTI